jgi:uncharacterized protein YecE (DUF72 family)
MMAKKGKAIIGTSGWHYKHWEGSFYPKELKKSDYAGYYARHFNSVEVNRTFYKLLKEKSVKEWYDKVPVDFIFSVKGSRYLTHMKKLNDPADAVKNLLDSVKPFKEKLGPVLFQLPPNLHINEEKLKGLFKVLPKKNRFAVELRNSSWYDEKVYKILKDAGIAFCIYELEGHRSPEVVTSDFVYIRLHGPGNKYQGSYGEDTLMGWAEKIDYWINDGKDVYCYFDNDEKAYAPDNALKLKELIKEKCGEKCLF